MATFEPIGHIECQQRYRYEAPRQGALVPDNRAVVRLQAGRGSPRPDGPARLVEGPHRRWVPELASPPPTCIRVVTPMPGAVYTSPVIGYRLRVPPDSGLPGPRNCTGSDRRRILRLSNSTSTENPMAK